jgi:hypothetical protein
METCSSETTVDFQRIALRYIPEDRTLHNHRCESITPYSSFNDQPLQAQPLMDVLNSIISLIMQAMYGGLISLWLYKENNKLRDSKNVLTLHILP